MYGRQFDYTHPLVSQITRESLDYIKTQCRDELTKDKPLLEFLFKLRDLFGIAGRKAPAAAAAATPAPAPAPSNASK